MKQKCSSALCLVAFGYTLWYMHYGNPLTNEGALSKIGLVHHSAFVVWGVLTFAALWFALVLAYRRYTKNKAYLPLLALSAVGMALTLAFDFDYDIKPDYYFHCAGSLAFSVITGIAVFWLFWLCRKEAKIFGCFAIATAAVLLIDLVFLLILKETALIEALPIFAGYIMLSAVNLRRDTVAVK